MTTRTAYAHASTGVGAGALYTVTYSDTQEYDRDVTYGYVARLPHVGYTVEITGPRQPREVLTARPINS